MKVTDVRSVYMLERVWNDGTSKPILVSHQADAIDAWLELLTEELGMIYETVEQIYRGWMREGYSLIHISKSSGDEIYQVEVYRVWILDFDPTVNEEEVAA